MNTASGLATGCSSVNFQIDVGVAKIRDDNVRWEIARDEVEVHRDLVRSHAETKLP